MSKYFSLQRPKYESLSTQEHGLDESYVNGADLHQKSSNKRWLSSVCIILITLVNFFLWYINRPPLPIRPLSTLKRPSPWIGFQSVNYSGSYFEWAEELTFPDVLGPISEDPESFPLDEHRYFSSIYGTLTRDDRRFLVTNELSAVAQFRTRETSLETCRLQLGLPSNAELSVLSNNRTEIQPHWNLDQPFEIDVWTIPTTDRLNMSSLSSYIKADRDKKLITFSVQKNNTMFSPEFPCVADSLQTFEFTCASRACFLDVWQDRVEYLIGLSLVQRTNLNTERR